jgi:hypothetical protein
MSSSQLTATSRLIQALLRGDREETDAASLASLSLPSATFYQQDERACLVPILPAAVVPAFSSAMQPLTKTEGSIENVGLLLRTGKSLKEAALCAVDLRGSSEPGQWTSDEFPLLIFRLPQALARMAEEALEALLRAAPETDAQVYTTPEGNEKVKRDRFWASHYGGVDKKGRPIKRGPSGAYQAYRDSIDAAIEGKLLQCSQMLLNSASQAAHGDPSGGDGIRVAELCGGDGSLAACLLEGEADLWWLEFTVVTRAAGRAAA